MDLSTILVWNVHGLNSKKRRDAVRNLVATVRPKIVCLQETKIQDMSTSILLSMFGVDLDQHVALPANGTQGGVLIAWKGVVCTALTTRIDSYSAFVLFRNGDGVTWWLTSIYGPQPDDQKILFLDELHILRQACAGPWLIVGVFNLIYRAADKNNTNVDRAMMGRFLHLIKDAELQEIELLGRRFTWSNERMAPTLVRLNRAFCTADWDSLFLDSLLQSTAAGTSDYCPLLLSLRNGMRGKRQFHFEGFWPKLDGFQDTVYQAWTSVASGTCPVETISNKLRTTSRSLQAWSQKKVGNVGVQLHQAC